MATKLTYPKLPHVKLGMWSIKQKIHYKTGIAKENLMLWGDSENTYLQSPLDLTQQQIDDINAIIARPDAQGPDTNIMVVGNSLILKDPYVYHAQNEADMGLYYTIWYRASGENGAALDEVVITPTAPNHIQTSLLNVQSKKAFEAAIVDSFRWE